MDGLTGLPTHHEVTQRLAPGVTPYGAIFDIDSLVWLTHLYGYRSSDEAIVRVAHVIQEAARQASGQTFRIGGDEFLAILHERSTHDQALIFAREVLRTVAKLQMEYRRDDDLSRRHIAINAVVCRVSAGLTANIREVREWSSEMIWKAKKGDIHQVEVVADAGDDLPPWA